MEYSMDYEIWKDIEGYEGLYQINNFGVIKSLNRFVNHGHSEKQFVSECILKPRIYNTGYYYIVLSKNGKKKNFSVHGLVAKYFIENKENKECVNHKNGIKTDYSIENLEWSTISENRLHAFRTGLQKPHSLKSVMAYKKNGDLVGKYDSIHDAARKLNLQPSKICSVCKGDRMTTGNLIFKYNI